MPGIQIIGAGGFLGKNLFRYLDEQQHSVLGTSHQKQLINSSKFSFLDLLNPNFDFLSATTSSIQFSIVCSGETNIDKCKTQAEMSKTLNVTHTIQLIKNLWKSKITPVFISSDAVFDGETGNYSEDDTCAPITQYGKQKRSVEEFLIASNKPWLIVRLCKVFDVNYQDHTLVTNWLDSLRGGNLIKCATDQFIAPTYITDLCRAIESLICTGKTGVYHACSPEIFSRFDLGLKVAQYFQIDQKKVEKCSIFDFNFIEPRSSQNTLNPHKFISELDFNFSTMESCLEKISANYEHHITYKDIGINDY
jgi:dTDP-4-dehydrorhamnose reductase